jgi:predicted amidohydrolase
LGSFETDFGRIGICICYDMMFSECAEALALSGAEIIFHPTAGYGWYDGIGEATLRTRANDNSVYIVTAKNWVHNGAGKSSVIDYWGYVLSDAGFHRNAIVTCEIDLDEKKTQPDWYYPVQTSGVADVRERSRGERRPELYGALLEVHPGLEKPDAEKQAEIIKKMKSGECRW